MAITGGGARSDTSLSDYLLQSMPSMVRRGAHTGHRLKTSGSTQILYPTSWIRLWAAGFSLLMPIVTGEMSTRSQVPPTAPPQFAQYRAGFEQAFGITRTSACFFPTLALNGTSHPSCCRKQGSTRDGYLYDQKKHEIDKAIYNIFSAHLQRDFYGMHDGIGELIGITACRYHQSTSLKCPSYDRTAKCLVALVFFAMDEAMTSDSNVSPRSDSRSITAGSSASFSSSKGQKRMRTQLDDAAQSNKHPRLDDGSGGVSPSTTFLGRYSDAAWSEPANQAETETAASLPTPDLSLFTYSSSTATPDDFTISLPTETGTRNLGPHHSRVNRDPTIVTNELYTNSCASSWALKSGSGMATPSSGIEVSSKDDHAQLVASVPAHHQAWLQSFNVSNDQSEFTSNDDWYESWFFKDSTNQTTSTGQKDSITTDNELSSSAPSISSNKAHEPAPSFDGDLDNLISACSASSSASASASTSASASISDSLSSSTSLPDNPWTRPPPLESTTNVDAFGDVDLSLTDFDKFDWGVKFPDA